MINSNLNFVRNNKVPSTFRIQVRVLQETRVPDVLRWGDATLVQTLHHQDVGVNYDQEEKGHQIHPETHVEHVF